MSQRDENAERTSNMERLREEAAACGPGCACNAGKSGRARWIIGALVIVIAGALAARAMLKSGSVAAQKADAEFSLSQGGGAVGADSGPRTTETSAGAAIASESSKAASETSADKAVVCGVSIRSLSDLDQKAMDKDGVFVFLAGDGSAKNRDIVPVIEKSAATLRGSRINMGLFTLEAGSSEYANLAKQVAPPCVLTMVKGRGALAVTDDITEPKLIQAFVAAANAGGGCGPSGCGPVGCP